MRSLIAATVAALCLALAVPGFAQTGTAAPDAATPSADVTPSAEAESGAGPAGPLTFTVISESLPLPQYPVRKHISLSRCILRAVDRQVEEACDQTEVTNKLSKRFRAFKSRVENEGKQDAVEHEPKGDHPGAVAHNECRRRDQLNHKSYEDCNSRQWDMVRCRHTGFNSEACGKGNLEECPRKKEQCK